MNNGTFLAAIDLGSNSFRLEVGRYDHGQIQRVDYLKETVRLGNGFDEERCLSPEVMARGWECLARFAERLAGFKPEQVRAVATQTLREAKNRDEFIQRGCAILGFPIEVIAGTEEARLIYQGVVHMLPQSAERRLVIDIGGRSTEMVLGAGPQALHTASYRVGSVAWSMRYFPGGEFTEQNLYRAEIAAQAVLEEALTTYPRKLWDVAYGASGTVGAVADILMLGGWPEGTITRDGLNWLVKSLLRAGNAYKVQLDGLKDDRRAVISGGVSILRGLMELLQIDTLTLALGALRHGVLLEMVERDANLTDARDVSVQRLAQKFAVDSAQGRRVSQVAGHLLAQIMPETTPRAAELKRKLGWAATLHEIGNAISCSDYHKHGAYILENADMMGFSLPELYRLGLLVLGHRGKLKKLDANFEDADFIKLLLALRLAVILCHARRDPQDQSLELSCNAQRQRFVLSITADWAQRFPQSTHLLRQEAQSWLKTSWTFELTVR
ncbi:MAG: Ppx/GppA family phosphatase [Rhodoferax sp.]|nr:Ppx/GppA family phosphatase [Rhodoferax sp.]OIP24743.1 MAG: exopolyphosphatase [Comamonadaceae bacterium CG2_30_60_41]PIW09032.1 MAG: exopolyphosphatase [Comamonadaceae bacterium CG17_big_fil_post_rev_8_21_14_2_50_60_13]PIY26104.1 MAG: exopolyphosphatase [Comamonadaceae bacterium CG_4_10_14_3_um_filter_60_75]PJC17414.1 MAG: exopolyphosphatase [Comamonadaceae bacterium CG_4_9_14_0_8_um_filter_60_18]